MMNSTINDVIQYILSNRVAKEDNFGLGSMGKVVGEDYKSISTDINEVSTNCTKITVKDIDYYISKMDVLQSMYEIIKLYKICYRSKDIELKMTINNGVYEYCKKVRSYNPEFNLAVKTLVEYIDKGLIG